jgi:hypothetical protein
MSATEPQMKATSRTATDRIAPLLQRLAAEPGALAAERRTLPGTLQARLAALLDAIDSIVLPRKLLVKSGHQEIGHLIVSHRRLVDIEMPGRTSVPPGSTSLAFTLGTRLVEMAAWKGGLSLSVLRRGAAAGRAEIACSVPALRSALDVATTEGAYDQLIRLVETQTFALLRWTAKGAQVQFTGTPSLRTTLHAIAESYLDMAAKTRADARAGALRTEGLMIPVEGDLAIVVANFGKQGFVSVLPRQTALDLVAAWQSRG